MLGLYLIMDGNDITAVENFTHDIYCMFFEKGEQLIYSVYLQQNRSTSIPDLSKYGALSFRFQKIG